jgi:hypothetical protein
MHDAFGLTDRPLFVPPWNRCTETTAQVLEELGFAVLCRDSTAKPLAGCVLPELPVTVDWFARRRGVRVDRAGRGGLLAESARDGRPVGVMLHHAVMTDSDLDELDDVLRLVADHPAVWLRTMAQVAGTASPIG